MSAREMARHLNQVFLAFLAARRVTRFVLGTRRGRKCSCAADANWAIEILLGRQQKRPVVTAIPARRMQKDQLPAEHTIPLCGNEHRASERPPCSHKEFVVVYLFRDLAEQESLRRHRPCVSETSSSAPPIEAQLIPSACMRSCDRSCDALWLGSSRSTRTWQPSWPWPRRGR